MRGAEVCSPAVGMARSASFRRLFDFRKLQPNNLLQSAPAVQPSPCSHPFRSARRPPVICSSILLRRAEEQITSGRWSLRSNLFIVIPLRPCHRSPWLRSRQSDSPQAPKQTAGPLRWLATASASAVGRYDRRRWFTDQPPRPSSPCLRESAFVSSLDSSCPSGAPTSAAPGFQFTCLRRPPLHGSIRPSSGRQILRGTMSLGPSCFFLAISGTFGSLYLLLFRIIVRYILSRTPT